MSHSSPRPPPHLIIPPPLPPPPPSLPTPPSASNTASPPPLSFLLRYLLPMVDECNIGARKHHASYLGSKAKEAPCCSHQRPSRCVFSVRSKHDRTQGFHCATAADMRPQDTPLLPRAHQCIGPCDRSVLPRSRRRGTDAVRAALPAVCFCNVLNRYSNVLSFNTSLISAKSAQNFKSFTEVTPPSPLRHAPPSLPPPVVL